MYAVGLFGQGDERSTSRGQMNVGQCDSTGGFGGWDGRVDSTFQDFIEIRTDIWIVPCSSDCGFFKNLSDPRTLPTVGPPVATWTDHIGWRRR
jgi:hypothetical protein